MGSFTFKWEHPAEEVYVTGTFDNWTKSVKLEKQAGIFAKTVDLDDASAKIYYKFVVDGNWVINESAPKEPDHEGNVNNFLNPDQISKDTLSPATLNTVTPQSTTAAMAAEQPIETKTTAVKPLDEKPVDASKPTDDIPETATPSDIPGGFPITPANDLDKFISVNPLPASEGGVNPIKLEPGEKIPESITTQSTDKYVKLDKESYEKSDALPGLETEIAPVAANTIPESSLPVTSFQDAIISSITPTGTTAALVADVPLEPKASETTSVPEVVKESQEKAHVSPEASAVPAEVKDKALVEEELKEKVPEAPATSVGTAEKTETSDNSLAALAATAGGAFIAAGLTAKETIEEKAAPIVSDAADALADSANKNLPDSVKEQLPVAAQDALAAKNREQINQEVSPEVPVEVKESLIEAGKSPEAAANTETVQEKKAVEAELLSEIKPSVGTHDAPITQTTEENKQVSPEVPIEVKESIAESGKSPEAAANTEAVEEKKAVEAELLKEVQPVAPIADKSAETVSDAVPTEVKDSIVESGKAPEAAANPEAVEEKKAVEAELLKEIKPAAAIEPTQNQTVAPEVPVEVKDSIAESGKSPEAAASPEAVQDKKDVETELLKEVKPVADVGQSTTETTKTETSNDAALPVVQSQDKTESTPKTEEIKTETVPKIEEPKVEEPKIETKSETPVATGNGTPAATGNGNRAATGNGSKPTETSAGSSAANGTGNGSTATKEQKKKNRLSTIFSKIKHKLSDK